MRPTAPHLVMCLPQGPVVSGIVVWAQRVTRGLAQRGIPSTLLFHQARADHAQISLNVPKLVEVVQTDLPPLGDGTVDSAAIANVYADIISSRKGHPVLCPNGHHGTYAAAARLRRDRPDLACPILSCCHNDFGYDYAMHAYYAPLLDTIIAPSAVIFETLRTRIGPDASIKPWPHAVPCAETRPAREPLEGRPLRLVYTGRMDTNQKRILTLVDLVDRLDAAGVAFEMRFVGDGPASDEVDRRLARHDHARRLPPCAPEAVTAHLDWADAFVLASRFEAICLAMYEAMARGCIPVVSRVSGVEQVIEHGVNGLLFDPDDLDGLERCITSLRRSSEPACQRLREESWHTVKSEHDLDAYVDRFATHLQEMIAAGTTQQPWPASRACEMPPGGLTSNVSGDVRARLETILSRLDGRRVAVWGAGRHTESLLDVFTGAACTIACVLDDNLDRRGDAWQGWPIAAPADVADMNITDVVISSAMHESALYARRAEVAPARVHRLYAASHDAV